MTKQIGIIGGTGPQGQGLALRWGMANEQVILGSRQREKAIKIAQIVNEKLGEEIIIPRTNEACIKESDIILITIPFDSLLKTITSFANILSPEQIIVDVTVPLKPFEKGKMVDLLPEKNLGAKSATEFLRNIIPSETPIVGAFKTLSNAILQDIDRFPFLNQDIYVLGKDKRAKHVVKEKASLIKKLRPVDAGGTLSARHIEHIVAFLIGLNSRYKTHDCGFTVSSLPVKEW
jgi:NADPH-dependent F420 reductase